MLDANLKQQLATYLTNINKSVELVVATDQSKASTQLLSLAKEIEAMSPFISMQESDEANARKPLMSVRGESSQIDFAGVPLGHEFTSLVLALLHTGGHPIKLSDDDIEAIKSIDEEIHFESFVSLSCQSCPTVVQALNMMTVLNPKIRHTMIDGALFQDEVNDKNIMAVPSVFANGETFSQGRVEIADILKKLDTGSNEKAIEKLNQKSTFDSLIIGAGPAGASAAIYSARKGLKTGIVADRFGGQVADTLGIENFISVKATEGPKLIAQLEEHVKDYDVDVMAGQRVAELIPGNPATIVLENGAKLYSHSVILATGARWREMNVPGEQEYRGKGVAYCPHCDGPLFKGKKVAVIGGGNSGIEAALDLANITDHVTVLEFDDKLRADDVLVQKANATSNITIIKQALTTEVIGDGNKVTGLRYTDRATDESHQIELSGIFVQIGLVPNTEFLPEEINTNPRKEIIVDAQGKTSVDGIFAAGDVTDVAYKQIIIAMGSGATASLGAFDYMMRLPAAQKAA